MVWNIYITWFPKTWRHRHRKGAPPSQLHYILWTKSPLTENYSLSLNQSQNLCSSGPGLVKHSSWWYPGLAWSRPLTEDNNKSLDRPLFSSPSFLAFPQCWWSNSSLKKLHWELESFGSIIQSAWRLYKTIHNLLFVVCIIPIPLKSGQKIERFIAFSPYLVSLSPPAPHHSRLLIPPSTAICLPSAFPSALAGESRYSQ